MQTVFDNSMTAHVWSQCRQPYGRSNNGNLYFDGNILYSYGSHFAVGVVKNGYAFLNSDTYSISTSQHQGHAWSAVNHLERIGIPDLTAIASYLAAPTFNREVVRKKVKEHLIKHALDMCNEPDVKQVLGHIGQSRSFELIMRKAGIAKRKANKAKIKSYIAYLKLDFKRVIATKGFHDKFAMSKMPDMAVSDSASLNAIRYINRVKTSKRQIKHVRDFRKAVILEFRKRDAFSHRKSINYDIRRMFYQIRHDDLAKKDVWQLEQFKETTQHLFNRWPSLMTSKMKHLNVQLAARIKQGRELLRIEREKQEKERYEAEKNKHADWLTGELSGYVYLKDELGGALLRVKDDNLETSQGAKVPLKHAIKAFKIIRTMREQGRTWQSNGSNIRVGHFQIDKISADGCIRAGCHLINWPEIKRISVQLGL